MEPRFVGISPGFEGADARPLRWLGRIVAQMDAPSAKYAPSEFDMRPILSRFLLQPMHDLDVVVFAKAIGNRRLALNFMKWIRAAAGTADEKALEIRSPRIATFSLQQHTTLLEDMKGRVEVLDEVLSLLRQSDRKACMIVGVKILYNA